MIFLVHEKAPVIDPKMETMVSDSRMILTKFADLLDDHTNHHIVRAPEKVIQMIDGVTPLVTYVEGFDTEEYIPKAESLKLRCPSIRYEELLMILNGREDRLENHVDTIQDVVKSQEREQGENDEVL